MLAITKWLAFYYRRSYIYNHILFGCYRNNVQHNWNIILIRCIWIIGRVDDDIKPMLIEYFRLLFWTSLYLVKNFLIRPKKNFCCFVCRSIRKRQNHFSRAGNDMFPIGVFLQLLTTIVKYIHFIGAASNRRRIT